MLINSFDFIFARLGKIPPFVTFNLKKRYYNSNPYFLLENDTTSVSSALTISATSGCSLFGTQIHARIIKLGFSSDVFSQNNLIKMYTKCGVLRHGLKVFDEMHVRNLVSWSLIISGAIQNGEFEMGFEFFVDMMRNGFVPNEFALGSIMKGCVMSVKGCENFGLCIHCLVLKIGMESNPFVGTSLLNMYARINDIQSMQRVFECTNDRDIGSWNAMLGGYAQGGNGLEAMEILSLMQHERMRMDEFTFIHALKGCSVMSDLNFGREIHSLIFRSEMQCNTSIMNALMDMYLKNCGIGYAWKVFNRMHDKDVVSWNILFSNFSLDHQDAREVASLFHKLMISNLNPSHVTFSILFRLCGDLHDLHLGFQFFCLYLHFGHFDEAKNVSSLVNMFSKCGDTEAAFLAFNSASSKNIVSWNEMIVGYSVNNCNTEALRVFSTLWRLGVEANEYTFSSALEACSCAEDTQLCRQIHGVVLKLGYVSNCYVYSSLFKAYAGHALLADCFELFNGNDTIDSATWGTMISSLVHQDFHYEAMELLRCMIKLGDTPNEFILGSILNGCAGTGAYPLITSVHSLVTKIGFESHAFVSSALLDAYAKSGDILSARLAFDQSICSRDIVLFNTMIMAYAHHGLVKEAMEIFTKVKLAHLKPSQSTFVSVLSAFSHMGLVDDSRIFFNSIKSDYGIEPCPDSYGCLVDMLSRNGFLDDAKYIIETMPFQPWPAILRTLLSGCRIHGNSKLGEWASGKLLQLVPGNDAAYLLLAKVYSERGSWDEAAKVRRRKTAKTARVGQKDAACSWIMV